jgi:hypothetical protein
MRVAIHKASDWKFCEVIEVATPSQLMKMLKRRSSLWIIEFSPPDQEYPGLCGIKHSGIDIEAEIYDDPVE